MIVLFVEAIGVLFSGEYKGKMCSCTSFNPHNYKGMCEYAVTG